MDRLAFSPHVALFSTTVAGETASVSVAGVSHPVKVTMPRGTAEFMGSWHLVQLDVDLGVPQRWG